MWKGVVGPVIWTAAPYKGWGVAGVGVVVVLDVAGVGLLAGGAGSVAARTVKEATREMVTKEAVNSQRRGVVLNIVQ